MQECSQALKTCKRLWSLSCGGVSNMLLVFSIIFAIKIYGVVCVQLTHFSSGDWKNIYIYIYIYIYIPCYHHHQVGSINLSHCYHIFPWSCVWDACYIIFCHVLHIHSGKTGILFSSLLCILWWVRIIGYVMACRSYSFVCVSHHFIIVIVQTYL